MRVQEVLGDVELRVNFFLAPLQSLETEQGAALPVFQDGVNFFLHNESAVHRDGWLTTGESSFF